MSAVNEAIYDRKLHM